MRHLTRTEFVLTHAATALVIAILALVVVRFLQRVDRTTDTPLLNIQNQVTGPTGMVVVLNKPSEQGKKNVLVNYASQSGETVRTKQIPNATAQTAQFQVAQDDVYVYTEQGDEPGLRRMDEGGSLTAMADIQRGVSQDPFWLVSPDGTLIAWSETTYATPQSVSTIFSAQVDGSQKKQIAQVIGEGEFYLRPFVWVTDQDAHWELWYVKQPIGLGGYILYSDPVGPVYRSNAVALAQEGNFLDVSEDGLIFAFLNQEVTELSAHVVDFALPLTGAGQAGEGALSPDNTVLALSVASGNPEQELGWVELWPIGSQTSVRVNPEDPTQLLHVIGWLNNETVVLAVFNNEDPYDSTVYVVNKDGSFFRKVWTGYPIGVVPAL